MTVKWLSIALENIEEIAKYITLDNPKKAMSFVQEIREKTKVLDNFPAIWRTWRILWTRELIVHKNYILTYRMKEGTIEILRIRHVARKA